MTKYILTILFVFVWQSMAAAQVPVRLAEVNIQYGCKGTDGKINCTRTAKAIYNNNGYNSATYKNGTQYPDVVSLVEVIGIAGGQPAVNSAAGSVGQITAALKTLTGKTWNSYVVPKYAGCTEGVAIISPWPLSNLSYKYMTAPTSSAYAMPILHANVAVTKSVNGVVTTRNIQFFATHWAWPSSDETDRIAQAKQSLGFMQSFAEPKFLSGDFNENEQNSGIQILLSGDSGVYETYKETWDIAFNAANSLSGYCHGTACGYSDNAPSVSSGYPYIRTRKSRVDKILFSHNSNISVSDAFVPDSRQPSSGSLVTEKLGTTDDLGVRHSDHNMYFTDIKAY